MTSFHFPIPTEYKEAVDRKCQAKKRWKAELRREKSNEKSVLMRKLVKLEFNKWLSENGYEREISLIQSE